MPRPLTQLRLSSLTLAKTSQPSPARGEGNKGRETVGHFLRLSPSGLSRGSRAGNRAVALDARDKPEHDNLFGVERSNACRQGPLTQLRLSSLTLAKTAQPSPARGEGNKGREPVRHFLRLSPSGLSRGSRASDGAAALDARNRSEHDSLFGVEGWSACGQGPLTQLRLSSLTLAKPAQPSPARGEGNKGREPVRHFLRLSPSGLSRGSRASDRAAALDARDKPEHDKLGWWKRLEKNSNR
jgi:hypothetical protein